MTRPAPLVYDLSLSDLEQLLTGWGEPAFRAKQVYRQLYVNLADGAEEMTDLPESLRKQLAEKLRWSGLEIDQVVTCDKGMTRKAVMRVAGGHPSETVLMVYPDRATVCVSSQSGCPLACVFCATGKLGLLHNMSPGEIIEQVLWAERELRGMKEDLGDLFPRRLSSKPDRGIHYLTNAVFMGMGEPFNNYKNWWAAVEQLHDPKGFNMGARHFTVSTVGLIPGIRKLAEAPLPINLAVSLHAADDKLREEMMPVNKAYPIADLLTAVREYTEKTRRRVSFEYVLLQEKNDTPEQARALAELLREPGKEPLLCHVNLIPWNPVPGTPLGRSHRERIAAFQKVLEERRVPCTVRVERGAEIAAACGQLAGTVG